MSEPAGTRVATTIAWVAVATIALLPLAYSASAYAPFIIPKLVVLRAGAIAVGAIAAIGLIWGRVRPAAVRDPEILLPGAILAWSAVTTIASTNRAASAYGLLYVGCVVALALGVRTAVRRFPLSRVLAALTVPAALNIFVLALQLRHIWSVVPLPPGYPERQRISGLLGNPDYLASYLIAPALVCVAAAIGFRSRRLMYGGAAAAFLGAIVVTESITALAAVSAGLIAIAALASPRRSLVAALLLLVTAGGALVLYPPLRARTEMFATAAVSDNMDVLFSGRTASVLAAWEMFLDHPLTGVGVHAYQYEFLPYRFVAEKKYPHLLRFASKEANFGEAHNDHVEVLAETGLPGYLLMLAVLIYVASRSWLRRGGEPPTVFSRALAFPLALSFGVLTLAQFPISIAAVVMTWIAAAYVATNGGEAR